MRISKKSLLIMAVLALIAASFLKRAVQFISNNLRHANMAYYSGQIDAAETLAQKNAPDLRITQVENSKKVIRGGFFELIAYIRSEKRAYGNYNLAINLLNLNAKTRTRCGEYPITEKDWPKDKIVRIGPVMVSVPPQIQLGNYIIELMLVDRRDSQIGARSATSGIEVISYSRR